MWRAWRGWTDLAPMQELAGTLLRDRPSQAFIHPGDLAWWLGWPPKTHAEIAAIAELFEPDRALRAWIAMDDDDIGECVDPDDHEALAREVDRRVATRAGVRYVRDDDAAAIARLTGAGYERADATRYVAFRIDLARADRKTDPRVRPVRSADDIPQRASVTRSAFNVARPFDRYVAEYARFMASPAYPAGWDLVAWGAEGDAAACAIAWPDPISGVGNFEPVATHPTHRRHGFATAVLLEGCRRLRAAGMTAAMVRTPEDNDAARALYRAAGFVEVYKEVPFHKR